MAYEKNTWVEPDGSDLNKFLKTEESATSVKLTHDPTFTNSPTPFTAARMNHIEDGIEAVDTGYRKTHTISIADAFKLPQEAILSSFASPGSEPRGLTFDGTNLISCDPSTRLIYIHDGVSSSILSSFASPGSNPRGLTFDGTSLISCDYSTSMIYIHDGVTSTILSSFAAPGSAAIGLTFDGTNLISCDTGTDLIYIHDGITSSIPSSFATPGSDPSGLAFDGTNLISCGYSTGMIYIHESKNYFKLSSVPATANISASGEFVISDDNGVTTVKAGIKQSASAKTSANTTAKIESRSGTPDVIGVLLAKSDTVNGAGAYLCVEYATFSGTKTLTVSGYKLLNFVLEDSAGYGGTLPDGSAASFLVAGSEFVLESGGATFMVDNLKAYKNSDTELRCTATFRDTIYPAAATVTITDPSVSLSILGTAVALVLGTIGGYTTTISKIQWKTLNFRIIASSGTPFSTLPANTELSFRAAGATSGKITLS